MPEERFSLEKVGERIHLLSQQVSALRKSGLSLGSLIRNLAFRRSAICTSRNTKPITFLILSSWRGRLARSSARSANLRCSTGAIKSGSSNSGRGFSILQTETTRLAARFEDPKTLWSPDFSLYFRPTEPEQWSCGDTEARSW